MAGLAADRISFAYGTSEVLGDVSARVAGGGLVGILGPNGSGKTTLLRVLAGLMRPSSGRIVLDGVDLHAISRATIARRMAVVPQETQLAFDYTVLEMATMGRYPHLGAFEVEGPEDLAIAGEALAATGTRHLASRLFNTLSGGEKQRVVIAGALAQNPDILLLDEPTASLDLAYQLEIRSILQKLNRERGLTIVVSTHDLNFAASLCRSTCSTPTRASASRTRFPEALTPRARSPRSRRCSVASGGSPARRLPTSRHSRRRVSTWRA